MRVYDVEPESLTPELVEGILTEALGERYTMAELEYFISKLWRKKLLDCQENFPLPPALTGCCLAFPDRDKVYIQEGLNPVSRKGSKLHEYGHLLMFHVAPQVDQLPTYEEFLKDPASYLQYALNRDTNTVYNTQQESEAETLARLLFPHVIDEDDDTPGSPLARELYNE
jgi:hypothetical protein